MAALTLNTIELLHIGKLLEKRLPDGLLGQ